MSEDATQQSDHGELKRRISRLIGSEPSRYAANLGNERHKPLLDEEITLICENLGLGFLENESKQQRMDAVMLKLGRDHRTGARSWDSSDLLAVIRALQADSDRDGCKVRSDGGTDADIQRVGDVDGETTVYYAPRTNGADTVVHLEQRCRHLTNVDPVFDADAGVLDQDRPVCQECVGAATFGPDEGTNVNATRRKLSAIDPDDAGLSPIGERPGQLAADADQDDDREIRTDGGLEEQLPELQQDILEFLERRVDRGNSYVKARQVANALGVSNTRAGKNLAALRDHGYLESWDSSSSSTTWQIVGLDGGDRP